MAGYIVNFSIYTLAMVGIIFAALFLFKGVMSGKGFAGKSDFLNVEETLNISPRKTIYVVKAGTERFLIAGDTERTSLIAKLGVSDEAKKRMDKSAVLDKLYAPDSLEEFSSVIETKRKYQSKAPLMRELARKLEF